MRNHKSAAPPYLKDAKTAIPTNRTQGNSREDRQDEAEPVAADAKTASGEVLNNGMFSLQNIKSAGKRMLGGEIALKMRDEGAENAHFSLFVKKFGAKKLIFCKKR